MNIKGAIPLGSIDGGSFSTFFRHEREEGGGRGDTKEGGRGEEGGEEGGGRGVKVGEKGGSRGEEGSGVTEEEGGVRSVGGRVN